MQQLVREQFCLCNDDKLDINSTFPLVPPPPPLNFSNLIYLRVLDLRRSVGLKTLPESIARLKLLRYLDLSRTGIALLSDEVFGNLINLQTLKLIKCYNLEMLPGNMRKLTNLRHLDITWSSRKLLGMPVGMGHLKCLHMLSHFVVSEESGCGVGELQELDHLGGTLAITCLWKVKDPRDAENAKLSKKENIRSLRLDWYKSTTTSPVPAESQTNSTNDEKLIADALQPHPNIEVLEFYGYGGSDFPRWMNYSTSLFSLVTLELRGCLKCKHLPTLGLLPHLKKLFLKRIPVECIGNEFYCDEEEGNNMMKTRGGMVLFPALEELGFGEMPSLEEWKEWSSSSSSPSSSRMKEGEVQVSVFPVLKRLRIYDCPNLRTFPSLPLSIQHLELSDCHEKIFERSLERLPHLSHLSISRYLDQGMVHLGLWNSNEKILERSLQNLQLELTITGCTMLASLPEGMQSLTSLKSLAIESCHGLKSLNKYLQLLTNLHELSINDCRELELLPDDFQNLVSLQSLRLEALPKLEAVPVLGSNQRSLKDLILLDCENLKSLPEGLQHLTALQELEIRYCHPELHQRCQENTGEDWHKIAHIQHLTLYYNAAPVT